MCVEPVTMAAMAAKTIGSVLSTAGTMRMAGYNRAVSKNRAAVSRVRAVNDALNIHEKGRQDISKVLTGFADGYVRPATGSSSVVAGSLAADTYRRALSRLHAGDLEATGHEADAGRYKAQKNQAFLQGAVGAGSTLLTAMPKAPAKPKTSIINPWISGVPLDMRPAYFH